MRSLNGRAVLLREGRNGLEGKVGIVAEVDEEGSPLE